MTKRRVPPIRKGKLYQIYSEKYTEPSSIWLCTETIYYHCLTDKGFERESDKIMKKITNNVFDPDNYCIAFCNTIQHFASWVYPARVRQL